MDIFRKMGICIVMIIPTFVGAGAVWDIFNSWSVVRWFAVFVWIILMAAVCGGIVIERECVRGVIARIKG